MDATFIAIVLQIAGWGLFFRGVYQLRREVWVRARLLLFWCSTALLGCSTFCFAVAPLLNWGQIGWLMLTGALCSVAASAMWGAFAAAPVGFAWPRRSQALYAANRAWVPASLRILWCLPVAWTLSRKAAGFD